MLKAIGRHDRVQCPGAFQKVHTGLPEPMAAVLLSKHQHGCSRVDLYEPAKFLLADRPQPRQRIGVYEMQQGLEHLRRHIVDPYARRGRAGGELRLQHR